MATTWQPEEKLHIERHHGEQAAAWPAVLSSLESGSYHLLWRTSYSELRIHNPFYLCILCSKKKVPQSCSHHRGPPCPSREGTGRCRYTPGWVVLFRSPQRAASQAGAASLMHVTCGTPTTSVPLGSPRYMWRRSGSPWPCPSQHEVLRESCMCLLTWVSLLSKPWGYEGPAAHSYGLLQLSRSLWLCELGHMSAWRNEGRG